ncbi:MAG: hypothetical protein E7234_06045 [Lachnospiraceae bacterium]|nr:hypothetical protein [Lachnospiraceae bacterium]
MQMAMFQARCPYEIGDAVYVKKGQSVGKTDAFIKDIRIITDIACVHFLKSGTVEFRYEFDGSGVYVTIQPEK